MKAILHTACGCTKEIEVPSTSWQSIEQPIQQVQRIAIKTKEDPMFTTDGELDMKANVSYTYREFRLEDIQVGRYGSTAYFREVFR